MMKAPSRIPSTPPVITLAGSRSGERVVAELARDVARPADDLAGFGQGSALTALAVLYRRVVAVVGGAGPGVGLSGLVHTPAQPRRPLPRRVPGGAPAIAGVHGDVQPGEPDCLARGGEPPGTAQPAGQRQRGDRPDSVQLPGQHPGAAQLPGSADQ